MAGKGGGSWKVAYADFVTAMMAFFLVMWIGAQDQKIKQAVANYFVDPSGASKKPVRTGAIMETPSVGSVAKEESVSVGRGRATYSPHPDASSPTKLVSDFLHADEKSERYWKEQVKKQRETAAKSPEVTEKKKTVDEVATKQLSKQLREEVTKGNPLQKGGLYQDLLFSSFSEVNWTEIAEDMLNH